MTVIAPCNDVCQCSLLKADLVILTKHGGMEWGFELSSATLVVISCYEKTMIAVIHLKCFWHFDVWRGQVILFFFPIVKGLSLFPLAQSAKPLMSKVLPLFDFVLQQSKKGMKLLQQIQWFQVTEVHGGDVRKNWRLRYALCLRIPTYRHSELRHAWNKFWWL